LGAELPLIQQQGCPRLAKHPGVKGLVIIGGKGVGNQEGGGLGDGQLCQGAGPSSTNYQVGSMEEGRHGAKERAMNVMGMGQGLTVGIMATGLMDNPGSCLEPGWGCLTHLLINSNGPLTTAYHQN
jgi:hypothetical protein